MQDTVLYKTPAKNVVQWFVVHVKWRKELEFAAMAEGAGMRTFVAKRNVLKEEKRGVRVIQVRTEVVEIPEIVFVNASHEQMEAIIDEAGRKSNLKVYYARDMRDGHRRIMTVRDQQMNAFIKIASQNQESITYLKPEEVSLSKGDIVKIHGGTFDGAMGTLLMVKGKRGKRVVVSIEGLTAVAAAYVTPDFIEVIATADSANADTCATEIDDLQAAADEYIKEGISEKKNAEGLARLKAMKVMAEHLLKSNPKSPSPSRDFALLTFARAVGDRELERKQMDACIKHLESLHDSTLKTRITKALED